MGDSSESDEESDEQPEPEQLFTLPSLQEEELETVIEEEEDLFNKNTESFRCFAQHLISRSSLLRHPLYHFPPLEDPGIDKAFDYIEPIIRPDNIGCEYYKTLCKDFGIVPLTRVLKSLPTNTLDLKFYSLKEKQIRAIMTALTRNEFVESLILQDNWLSPESIDYICEMFEENNIIKYVNFRECRIKPEGASKLCYGIETSYGLHRLDLSFNSLGDKGMYMLEAAFLENITITELNFSHNNLGEESAKILARIFTVNNFVEYLDLSWNNFYSEAGNKKLFEALGKNRSIKVLNLAWNGICTKGAALPISKYMRSSAVLEHLDLSNNSLTGEALRTIRLGMLKSSSLIGINLSCNPITPDEALFLLRVFVAVQNQFQCLEMASTYVKKEFLPIWKRIAARGKDVTIAGVLSNYKIRGPDTVKLLFDRARLLAMKAKKKKARKDFGHFILTMPDDNVSKEDFATLVKKFKMKKVDKDLVQAIMDKFPAKKQNIDLVTMKEAYMKYFPDTVLPPPKPKKGKKGKKDKKGDKKDKKDAKEPAEGQPPTEGQPPIEGQPQAGEAGEPPAELPATGGEPTEGQPPTEEQKQGEAQQNNEAADQPNERQQ